MWFAFILISEHFAPAEWVIFWLWSSQSLWFLTHEDLYVDDDGYARPGWPQAIARTRDFMKMLVFDPEPFLSNPEGKNLRLGYFDFFNMILITILNMFISGINGFLYEIPYTLNFIFVMGVYYLF